VHFALHPGLTASKVKTPREEIEMPRKSVHVTPAPEGGWNVKTGGASRAAAHTEHKTDAIDRGREISQHKHAELVIHNKDGRISQSDSHGHDPYPPKG
jgi:uncharacterized protein YdaT